MTENREWMKQIFQIVMVVENVDQTVDNWKNMVEFDEASIAVAETASEIRCLYKGKEINCPTRYATFDLGGVQMKVVEPLNKEGGNPYSDALLQSGPGIHHIGFCAENYDALLQKYQEAGKTPLYEEIDGEKHYMLYDFSEKTGFKVAPWDHMEGPCAR